MKGRITLITLQEDQNSKSVSTSTLPHPKIIAAALRIWKTTVATDSGMELHDARRGAAARAVLRIANLIDTVQMNRMKVAEAEEVSRILREITGNPSVSVGATAAKKDIAHERPLIWVFNSATDVIDLEELSNHGVCCACGAAVDGERGERGIYIHERDCRKAAKFYLSTGRRDAAWWCLNNAGLFSELDKLNDGNGCRCPADAGAMRLTH